MSRTPNTNLSSRYEINLGVIIAALTIFGMGFGVGCIYSNLEAKILEGQNDLKHMNEVRELREEIIQLKSDKALLDFQINNIFRNEKK